MSEVASEVKDTISGNGSKNGSEQSEKSSLLSPRNLVILIIVGIAALAFGIHHWLVASKYVSTDDAYLTADIVQIAPQVSGTVKQILVKENQEVKKGDLLVVLDDAPYKATVAQRKADLDAAIAQAKAAGVNVKLTSEQGNAQTMQAEGIVGQADSGITGAMADVERSKANVTSVKASARSIEAGVQAAESAVNTALINKRRYQEAVTASEAQLESAQANATAAEANVTAAEAACDKAVKDAKRYSSLSNQGAASKQRQDEAEVALAEAKAKLESAKEQAKSSKSTVNQRKAELSSAKEQLESADASIAQAKAQLAATCEQAAAAAGSVKQAEAQSLVLEQTVHQAQAKKRQALGQLTQARTAPRQVDMSLSAEAQAKAKIEQAQAALDAAQLQLDYTRMYAPADGRVSKKSVEIGALVQIGTPLMALVISNNLWIAANFKETQLAGLRPGCEAQIKADAVPGKEFKGKVESTSPATGATFALLPPDNATGNFTKVVQRIPIKIVIDPDQPGYDSLCAGMSVVAKVKKR